MIEKSSTRIDFAGVERPAEKFVFSFEGERIDAFPGESIAAAMIAAGHYRFRASPACGSERGMFCGMGVCGECQVLIDGHSRRACMEKALPGMHVRRHPALRSPGPSRESLPRGAWEDLAPDVLVVGGGPAGLSAAMAAAECGLDVVVVDERQQPGGQFYKHPPDTFSKDPAQLDRQFNEGISLTRRARACGIRYLSPATVCGTFEDQAVAVAGTDGMQMIRARRIVIATGAYERPIPFPGWTLPGVMTTGAAQTLLRGYQITAGSRVLIAGNGPLNLQVADELSRAGAKVVAIAELAPAPYFRPLRSAQLMLHGPRLAVAGLRHLAALYKRRVPVLYRHVLTEAAGDGQVERVTLAATDGHGQVRPQSEQNFDVDAVCMNYGFLPQSELARSLGCNYRHDARHGTDICERSSDGRSNVESVFVVGDAGGLGGAKLALDQGALAGCAIALDLGAPRLPERRRMRRLDGRIAGHARFQRALWAVFRAPCLTTELATPKTLICRCESLELDALQRVISSRCNSLAAIKKLTRAGMGRCQGRYCTVSLNSMLGKPGHRDDSAASDFFAPRPPIKPLPVGLLAGHTGANPQPRDLLAASARDDSDF